MEGGRYYAINPYGPHEGDGKDAAVALDREGGGFYNGRRG